MSDVNAYVFRGGRSVKKSGAAIVGDVVTYQTVPAGTRWVFDSLYIQVVADANAANRFMAVHVDDGTDFIISYITHSGATTAGQTRNISFIGKGGGNISGAIFGSVKAIIFVGEWVLEAGDRIGISILAGLAGDTYEYRLRVREMKL